MTHKYMYGLALGTLLTLFACGPDPVTRASEEPWSTKQNSVRSLNDDGLPPTRPQGGMTVHGETVRASAMNILSEALASNNSFVRANAIEAMRYAPREDLSNAVRIGLGDENRGVRFVSVMLIGELKLCNDAILLEPLMLDQSQSVQAAALFSMYRCGKKVNLNPIAVMLQSNDPELRGNAALVLGRMGNSSAIALLHAASREVMDGILPIRRRLINLQLSEALVLLGEKNELQVIRAAVYSSAFEAEVTALACQILGRLHDVTVLPTLEGLASDSTPNRQPAEVQLVAATAVAEITPSRMPTELVLQFSSSQEPHLRAQCAVALGVQGNQLSLGPLALLLKDRDPLVQIAAAGAILRIDNEDSMVEVH
jgi:HEAT repeat protein